MPITRPSHSGLGILLLGLGGLLTACGPAYSITPSPTKGNTPTQYSIEALNATAGAIVGTLPTASPNPALPPNKAASFQETDLWKRAYATALALYPAPPGYYPSDLFTPVVPVTPWPTEPVRAAGAGVIYEDGSSTLFGKRMVIVNKWWEFIGDQMVIVCAGGQFQHEDALQGEILVAIEAKTTHSIISGPDIYLTSLRAGYLRVVDAVGERLTLQAANGNLLYFDVPSRQWIPLTPGPSPSPGQSPLPSPSAGPSATP